MNVWRRVRQYVSESRTSIIHGKYAHEECRATSSRARENGSHYVVVFDKAEAQLVCDMITGADTALSPDAFRKHFEPSLSPGFDPTKHLTRIGVANQTTMLSSESLEIAGMFKEAVASRFGEEALPERFRSFDTICSATQDLQDAALELGRTGPLDLVLVIGGYNSSNTTHLVEISQQFAPAYHVDGAEEIHSKDEIYHQPLGKHERTLCSDWLPEGPITVGITAGASTPNRIVGEVIERLVAIRGIELSDWLPTPPRAETRLPVV